MDKNPYKSPSNDDPPLKSRSDLSFTAYDKFAVGYLVVAIACIIAGLLASLGVW